MLARSDRNTEVAGEENTAKGVGWRHVMMGKDSGWSPHFPAPGGRPEE